MPFGDTGIRVLKGQSEDAHYGWGGPVVCSSGKLIHIYRKGASHAITDGAEVRICESLDGQKWFNDRQLYQNALHDARPDPPRLFANGRIGVLINRASVSNGHFSPIVVYSDDEFDLDYNETVIPLSSPYTFTSTGGWMDFPASQGGHDAEGFIAFGYADGGGFDAIHTSDNLETFQITYEVASAVSPITALSEWSGARVADGKYIFYLRNKIASGWAPTAVCFKTTNLLNWGSQLPSGKSLGGNPPFCFSNPASGEFYFGTFARAGRGVDGYDHHMLMVSADGMDLWNADGDWSALGLEWEVVTPVPNWATGYFSPIWWNGAFAGTFTCAEPGSSGGARAAIGFIGNFTSTDAERTQWFDLFTRSAIFGALRMGYGVSYAPSQDSRISVAVDGNTLGLWTETFGNASRDHVAFGTASGIAGRIKVGHTTADYQS